MVLVRVGYIWRMVVLYSVQQEQSNGGACIYCVGRTQDSTTYAVLQHLDRAASETVLDKDICHVEKQVVDSREVLVVLGDIWFRERSAPPDPYDPYHMHVQVACPKLCFT